MSSKLFDSKLHRRHFNTINCKFIKFIYDKMLKQQKKIAENDFSLENLRKST